MSKLYFVHGDVYCGDINKDELSVRFVNEKGVEAELQILEQCLLESEDDASVEVTVYEVTPVRKLKLELKVERKEVK